MSLLTSIYGFAFSLHLFALLFYLTFVKNSVHRFRKDHVTGHARRQGKFGQDLGWLIGGTLFFFAGLAFLNFALFIESYRTFTEGEPVARVIILPGAEENMYKVQIQELGHLTSDNSVPQRFEFVLKGDQWTLEGNIIRFDSWINYLGVKPIYQFTRIRGGYFKYETEMTEERSMFPLVDEPAENWWKWMYKNGDAIPFINMVYGSGVTQMLKEGYRFDVSVLPSGFLVQRTDE